MKRTIAALAAAALSLGTAVAVAPAASAGQSVVTASCADGLVIQLVDFERQQEDNTLSVRIDGRLVTDDKPFSGEVVFTYAIPQNTASHTYKVEVYTATDAYNGVSGYTDVYQGTVAPCVVAKPAVKPPVVKKPIVKKPVLPVKPGARR